MRAVNAAAQAQREQRGGLVERAMMWITARNWDTGAPEAMGLWSGPDNEDILVTDMYTGERVIRMFNGAGSLLSIEGVRHEAGLNIRPVTVRLSAINPAVMQAVRGYDVRSAPVQVWRRSYDPSTMKPIAVEAWFKGYCNAAPIERPAPGGEAGIEMEIVSTARMLTIASNAKKSHEAQKRRLSDAFRRYKASAGTMDVPWGSKDSRAK